MKHAIVFFIMTTSFANAQESTINAAKTINEPLSTGSVIQITTALLVVLGVIFLGAYLFRRYGKITNDGSGYLKIISGISVGPRERIIILKAGNKDLVIGIMPGNITTLCELDDFEIKENKYQSTINSRFSDKLNGLLKRKSD